MRSRFLFMEKQFICSKNVLKKARVTFWFYAACISVIAILFLLPILLNAVNRIEWVAIIYALIILLFLYRGYRAFCVLRAIRKSYCCICDETVSGISIPNPFQKAIAFQIQKSEITMTEEQVVATDHKTEISYSRYLHRPSFTPADVHGYRSVIIHTDDRKYTLFAIELTDDIKDALECAR